jgi:hypothetical protein
VLVLVPAGGDGDRDADGVTELMAEDVGDQLPELLALQDVLGVLVGRREHRGTGHQCERLDAAQPLGVRGLEVLPLRQQFLQDPRPHCGKIGAYVSHRARSLGLLCCL